MASRTLAAVALVATLTVTPTANASDDGGPTYGGKDRDTPTCVTHQEWRRLHANRDRPRWHYVKRNLFGSESHYITWTLHGVDTAYGHATCWDPRRKTAKVWVNWSPRWSAYRVVDKAIR